MDPERAFNGKFMESSVLVTGCSGFVGTYLIRRLTELGANVFGLDRWKADPASFALRDLSDAPGSFECLTGNLLDMASLANIVDRTQPDYVVHLAAQSYVPESFSNPVYTIDTNVVGTANLLEVLRRKQSNARIVFAGSSEEYGLVFFSDSQLARIKDKYGAIFPEPVKLPELPISETNPLRPMSPYAVSKIAGDYLMRNYYHSFGIETIVSRAFNHEGAGRGSQFVTSVIAKQIMRLVYGETTEIVIGDVSAFRDWSHVSDIVDGYLLLALKGKPGEVYNQGSQRTNSVLSYILLALKAANWNPLSLSSASGGVKIKDPINLETSSHFGIEFETTAVDRKLLEEQIQFGLEDKGILIKTDNGEVNVRFDPSRFRPSDVPILLSSTRKIREIGFSIEHSVLDIVRDQLNFYLDAARRAR
jgi:GDPmannose 4,6-dehydratase